MTKLERSFAIALTAVAASVALLAFVVDAGYASFAMTRIDRAALDRIVPMIRGEVSGADAAALRARVPALRARLAGDGLSVAAFDAAGHFIGGDPSIGADGALADHPRPPVARQVAVIPGASAYLVLAIDAPARAQARAGALITGAVFVIAVTIAAWFVGPLVARRRLRGVEALRARLDAVGRGAPPLATVHRVDPASRELDDAADAALHRLGEALALRETNEERLRAFLADAGHEMRTPLAITAGYLGVLRRGGFDPALAERIVGAIDASTSRMTALVDAMLRLARLDAVAVDTGRSDAARVASEAIELVRPLDVERKMTLRVPDGVWLDLPADDLRDALRNLLENAIRYAPEAPIDVSGEHADGTFVVRVADSGPGMTAFERDHAFDRFFRGALRGDVPGSGLGLSIVQRIVERAGGSVTIDAAPGAGTTVAMRFPQSQSTPA